jgi:hypothetical protein
MRTAPSRAPRGLPGRFPSRGHRPRAGRRSHPWRGRGVAVSPRAAIIRGRDVAVSPRAAIVQRRDVAGSPPGAFISPPLRRPFRLFCGGKMRHWPHLSVKVLNEETALAVVFNAE